MCEIQALAQRIPILLEIFTIEKLTAVELFDNGKNEQFYGIAEGNDHGQGLCPAFGHEFGRCRNKRGFTATMRAGKKNTPIVLHVAEGRFNDLFVTDEAKEFLYQKRPLIK